MTPLVKYQYSEQWGLLDDQGNLHGGKSVMVYLAADVEAVLTLLDKLTGGEHRVAIIQAIRSTGQRAHRPAIAVEDLAEAERLLAHWKETP